MLRCSLSYAKIVQTECRTTSLLDCYAEVQPILCKGNAKSLSCIVYRYANNKLLDYYDDNGVFLKINIFSYRNSATFYFALLGVAYLGNYNFMPKNHNKHDSSICMIDTKNKV